MRMCLNVYISKTKQNIDTITAKNYYIGKVIVCFWTKSAKYGIYIANIAVYVSSNSIDMIYYYYLFNVDFIEWPFLWCIAIQYTYIHFRMYGINWYTAHEKKRGLETVITIEVIDQRFCKYSLKIVRIICINENFNRNNWNILFSNRFLYVTAIHSD